MGPTWRVYPARQNSRIEGRPGRQNSGPGHRSAPESFPALPEDSSAPSQDWQVARTCSRRTRSAPPPQRTGFVARPDARNVATACSTSPCLVRLRVPHNPIVHLDVGRHVRRRHPSGALWPAGCGRWHPRGMLDSCNLCLNRVEHPLARRSRATWPWRARGPGRCARRSSAASWDFSPDAPQRLPPQTVRSPIRPDAHPVRQRARRPCPSASCGRCN